MTEVSAGRTDKERKEPNLSSSAFSSDHMGSEFVLAFPFLGGTLTSAHLYITSFESTFTGYLSSPYPGISRNFSSSSGFVDISLPVSVDLPFGISNRSIYIKTSKPVSVYGINFQSCCLGEGFYIYPKEKLGYNYIAATYTASANVYLVVISTDGDTQVNVTLNQQSSITYYGRTYKCGEEISISLHDMEVAHLYSTQDLSGITLQSSKSVAVITGNACAKVPTNSSNCNEMKEYLLPTSSCGTKYIVPPVYGDHKIVRIFASNNDTKIQVSEGPNSYVKTMSSHKMEEISFNVSEVQMIETNYAVCVYLFVAISDAPFMTLLPSVNQYVNNVVFPRPTISNYNNYVSVIMRRSALPNFRLNGKLVSKTSLKSLVVNNTDYVSFWIPIENLSIHYAQSIVPYDTFCAIAYGIRYPMAYGYPVAINFR